jgi:pyridoxal phosphate enzyme (YggS family)
MAFLGRFSRLANSATVAALACLHRSTHYSLGVDLLARLNLVQQRIGQACARANRDPASVQLVAVSKGQPPEVVQAAADLGLNLFGESKVQEARAKIEECPGRLRWHLIGHLQTNKCRDAVRLFQLIESVDSQALAEEINKWAEKETRTVPILLEVNVAGEASKFGFKPEQLPVLLTALNALPKIEIHGLMTIAPWSPEPEKVRPIFRALRELKSECEEILGASLAHLSMGMSGDFEIAIEEGATMVRIGTALFGPRSQARKKQLD